MESVCESLYRPQKRSGHVTVVVGKFLFLWGGFSDEIHNNTLYESKYLPPGEMWVYHSDTDQWINAICNGSPPPGLAGASAVIVNDGLYIIFGHSGRFSLDAGLLSTNSQNKSNSQLLPPPLCEDVFIGLIDDYNRGRMNSLWRMDLNTKAWEEIRLKEGALRPSPRDKGSAWSHNNKIYWFGGYGSNSKGYIHEHGYFIVDSIAFQSECWNNQLLEFDVEEEIWRDVKCTGDIPLPRAAHAVAKFDNSSHLYLFGGRHKDQRMNDLYCLNHDTNNWTRLHIDGPEPDGRSWHTFSAVPPNYFLLVGGYTTDFEPLGDAWVLDRESLQWTEIYSPLNTPRLWHTAAVTCDNEVLVFGGCCNNIMDDEVETEYSNDLVIFRLAPKSLLRLCLDAAFNHRSRLQSLWETDLPKDLSKVLTMRLEVDVVSTG